MDILLSGRPSGIGPGYLPAAPLAKISPAQLGAADASSNSDPEVLLIVLAGCVVVAAILWVSIKRKKSKKLSSQ